MKPQPSFSLPRARKKKRLYTIEIRYVGDEVFRIFLPDRDWHVFRRYASLTARDMGFRDTERSLSKHLNLYEFRKGALK